MRIILSLAGCFIVCLLQAQSPDFEETVETIQKKVSCCSVPFSASTKNKVDHIAINKNGNISLSYSGNKPMQTFNIFNLYKEEPGTTGIDTILKGKFIQFYVSEKRIRLIRFATRDDAKEAYQAFQRLFFLCRRDANATDSIGFDQAVAFINCQLLNWAEGGKITLSAQKNGNITISNKGEQIFHFNIKDTSKNGRTNIELVDCDKKVQAPIAWLNFYKADDIIAFIRLKCSTPRQDLQNIRDAFLYLQAGAAAL